MICGRHRGEAVRESGQNRGLIDKMGRTLADVATASLLFFPPCIVAAMPINAFAEHDAPAPLADQAVLFPLSIAPSKGYLQEDAAGRPFLSTAIPHGR